MHFLFGIFLFALIITVSKPTKKDPKSRNQELYNSTSDENTLILTHVIFRHGNRTADKHSELYPNDPYLNENYHPYGHGQLTRAGKQKEFSVGRALRNRYHEFLGEYYYPDIVEALSTDYNRTKVSLQLVLAGLFPPRKEDIFEDGIHWQPVPYNYLPKEEDKVLLGVLCPRYLEMYEEVTNSAETQALFEQHKNDFDYISHHTGLNISRFFDVYNLYFGLSTEEEWGFDLPEWTKPLWPETITNLAIKDYFVSMATHDMKKMASGYFLQKVIEDTKNKILSSQTLGRKIHLYSAHENNLSELLMILDIFEPHVPNYGAYIAIEVHFIDNVYGIKIFYENYHSDQPHLLSIPNCGDFCPLDRFISIVEDFIPADDLCGI